MNPNISPALLSEICQIALTITDLDRAIAFYKDKLSLKHLFSAPPGMAFFACGSIRLMLSKPEQPANTESNSVLYFRVPDIQRTHDDLSQRGVLFEAKPHLVARMPDHELWMAFFRDPDRNLLALMCEKGL